MADDIQGDAPAARGDSRTVTIAAYIMLGVAGLLLGIVETFSWNWTIGSSFPISAILAVAVNGGLMWAAGTGMRSRLGTLVPAIGWLIPTLVFMANRPEGSFAFSDEWFAYLYLGGAMVAALVAASFVRGAGNWVLPQAEPRDRGRV